MLGRRLDRSFAPEVRANVTAVTLGRLTGNAAYRFSGPFLGAIARGMHVTLGQIGVAVAVGETSGLLSPLTGRLVDRLAPRRAMWWGLVGVAAGASAAGSAPNLVAFAAGLFLLGWAKSVYDIGLGAWIAGHVAYERRSRVVGLTETSWALGLLVGVSLMGLITGVASPRWAYAAAAVVVVVMAGVLRHRLPEDHTAEARPVGVRIGRISRSGMVVVGGMLLLAAGAQALFVTFGSWLQDQHGFSSTTLAVVSFGLGAAEARRIADVGPSHRCVGQGAQRGRGRRGDGARGAGPRRGPAGATARARRRGGGHRHVRIRHRQRHRPGVRTGPRLGGPRSGLGGVGHHARPGPRCHPGHQAVPAPRDRRPGRAHRRAGRRGGRGLRPPGPLALHVISLGRRSGDTC
ncbi:MAG: MFS transporter [Ilumatobacteraceae bacterium]